MSGLAQPLTVFTSQKPFNDRNADDMKCGDLDEKTLKDRFKLYQVSPFIDYCTYRSPYDHPALRRLAPYTKERVIEMLFNDMKTQSKAFSFVGTYKGIIARLIDHMHYKDGADYYDLQMNQAYKEAILNDKSDDSMLNVIQEVLNGFDYKKYQLASETFSSVTSRARLPKFIGWQSCINGLGVSIHDVNSTKITIDSLDLNAGKYSATVHFKAQDHFGLDTDDISKTQFSAFTFFRIWFVLQRFNRFAFKPFFTNFEAKVTLTGKCNV
ncbi:YPO3983 family protein [Cronobacter universalis]